MKKITDLKARLLKDAEVREGKCWDWRGAVFKSNGRPRIALWKGTQLAARISYKVFKGDPGQMLVLHSCDNIRCVNPDHLSLGTNKDNTQDMIAKGRNHDQHGENNGNSILTVAKVRKIREKSSRGVAQRLLAVEYGVSTSCICHIICGKTWKGV